MDFGIIYQAKNKKFWWIDIVFYFAVSLLIATVLSYFIFIVKISLQEKDLKDLDIALQTVGTDQQKDYEKTVLDYQKKISDFASLIKGRGFASVILSFMEQNTLLNVWFDKFIMNKKDGKVSLSGEADSMAVFSRQVANFEKSEHVKKITVLNSNLGYSGRAGFNLDISMDPKIFSLFPLTETTSP